jgi:hypothetical protein
MLPSLNRTAIVLRPKAPFLAWVRQLLRDTTEEEVENDQDLVDEPNVYLIPDSDSYEVAVEDLSDYAELLFESELGAWTLAIERWPKERDWSALQDWFDYEILGPVLDACPEELVLEEWEADDDLPRA